MEIQTSCQSCISSTKLQGQVVTVHTSTVHCIQVTRQFHDPAALTPEWAAQPVLTLQRREKHLATAGNRSPDYPARNLLINSAPYFFHTR
jgi:hypothetical protein